LSKRDVGQCVARSITALYTVLMSRRQSRIKSRRRSGKAPRAQRDEFVAAALRILAHADSVKHRLDARTIAAEAGRSLGSLTFQFKGGLWELRAATAAKGLSLLAEAIREEQGRTVRTPLEGLKAMGQAYVHFALGHERLYRLILSELWDQSVSETRAQIRRVVREHVMLCQVTGAVRLGDPERLTRLVAGVVWGITQAALDGEVPKDQADDAVAAAIDDLLSGIAQQASSKPY
jgi:WHG domain-containing protein